MVCIGTKIKVDPLNNFLISRSYGWVLTLLTIHFTICIVDVVLYSCRGGSPKIRSGMTDWFTFLCEPPL